MSGEALAALRNALGPTNVLTAPEDTAPYLREWRDLFRGEALAIVRPGSTAEVAETLRIARTHGLAIVPQGGNTGLVGGQIPMGAADGNRAAIVLSLTRMNRIREVDAATGTLIAEAGVTLAAVQEAAEGAGAFFPLSLASEGSCTIGGNLATNAGGTAVLAYGNMRDLALGLEVVLPNGAVLNGLSRLRKDNTGYDVRNLFIGSEGTLGIITAAVLKLFPAVRARATAFCGVPSPEAALALMTRAKAEAGGTLTTFEIMPRFGIEIVLRHAPGTREPLAAPHPWYVLMETSATAETDLDTPLAAMLESALEAGEVEDATLAASLDQRADFWRLREAMSETQRFEGGSIKHDVSVPVASVPAFLTEASAAVLALMPGARPLPFGHLGDGNIHFNISQPLDADKGEFLARWDEVNTTVHGVVAAYGGSISAEHGIGRLKRHLLPGVKDPVALGLMRALKRTIDPDGILNPGSTL